MSTISTPLLPEDALALIATRASAHDCTFAVAQRTITYDSQVEQEDVTEDVPATGFLILAAFPSENHRDMKGPTMWVETVEERAALPGRLRNLYFDWAPVPAWGVDVYDLTTGGPVEFTVIRDVQLGGVAA